MKHKTEVTTNVGEIRKQRGLSAAALAQAVGVSRQTIYAIEAGTYIPNTMTSLQLARVLDVSVEQLFRLSEPGAGVERAELAPGGPALAPGQAVQLSNVNGRLVATACEPASWCLPPSDGVIESNNPARVHLHNRSEDFSKRVLLAGCDPAMGMMARYLERQGIQMVLCHQNSSRSLQLLKDGYAHVAGSHLGHSNLDAVGRLFPAESAALISFALWQEGLAAAPGNPKNIKGIEDLARQDVQIVNREAGAGSRALLDRHLKRLSLDSKKVRGYETTAPGHLAAALEVKTGSADCCLSTEAAARFFGLHFIALESVRYELVVRKQDLSAPTLQPLLDSLTHLAFRRMLSGIGGYDTSMTGNRVA
jgi:molybdate-binding protein/DNA-binding XRE family transcriptional regulator